MTTGKESKTARRERLAEERAAQAAAERRRRRLLTVVGGIVVVALVVGVGVAVQASRNDTTSAALPATVTAPGGPIVRNPGVSNVPVLDYWEDFQCPICKQLEDSSGDAVRALVASGSVVVNYHMLSFLDGNLHNDSSRRSANAFACSAASGMQGAYHDTVFANQAAKEGGGYTDAQLLQFGTDVGITGDAYTTFSDCVGKDTYGDYVTSVATAGAQEGINATPTVFLNGTKLDNTVASDPAALTKAVNDASAG
jgi:protein-disulfide isomerase